MSNASEARTRMPAKPRGKTRRTIAFEAAREAERQERGLTAWINRAEEIARRQISARQYEGQPTPERLIAHAKWLRRGAARRLEARPDRDAILRALLGVLVLHLDGAEFPAGELDALVESREIFNYAVGVAALAAAESHSTPETKPRVWLDRIEREWQAHRGIKS